MRERMVTANGLRFRCLCWGDPSAPAILMLHGFPEYAGAWEEVAERLSDDFHCIAPDQRGYGLSDKPAAVADYAAGKLAADAAGIARAMAPNGLAAVFGHDWGASVAYALAFRNPALVRRLIIANGVHPIPFQRALAHGGAQSEASQYIDWLRAEGSEDALSADGFARMRALFAAKMDMGWLQGARLDAYLEAWSQPGAARGMVNWYRATPLRVARPGAPIEMPEMDADAMRVAVPHLLLWGVNDAALLPETHAGLDAFCDAGLVVEEHPEADHWILHQRPDWVAERVRAFLDDAGPAVGI